MTSIEIILSVFTALTTAGVIWRAIVADRWNERLYNDLRQKPPQALDMSALGDDLIFEVNALNSKPIKEGAGPR